MQFTSILFTLFSTRAIAMINAAPDPRAGTTVPGQCLSARDADWADRRIHTQAPAPHSKGPHNLYARESKLQVFEHPGASFSRSHGFGRFAWPKCEQETCYNTCVCQTSEDGSGAFLHSRPGKSCGGRCAAVCEC